MTKRPLTGEENKLWRQVTSDIAPLASVTPPASPPETTSPAQPAAVAPPITMAAAVAVAKPAITALPQPRFDRHSERQLRKGQLPVEARLDLHGLTENNAHRALANFIEQSAAAGKRVLLVVTGKGRMGEGVIRRHLPGWLEAPALRPHVVAYRPALPQHGGDGAFYIILRRKN